ncbi:Alpha/Beta hydrolase protein [Xylogone sp. PMI_703]|nr:Alpha/Beta hydrolase protein [Xylogone sp. PMI_703]
MARSPPVLGQTSSLSEIDPEFKELLASLAAPKFSANLNIDALRERVIASKRAANSLYSELGKNITIEDRDIKVRDGASIPIRIYSPIDSTEDELHPLFVMIHGGGWATGSLESEEVNCKLLCEKLGIVMVDVGYRLAPEHKFPTGLHDGYDAVKWAAENASNLKADLRKGFILGGSSSGANLCAAIIHTLRDESFAPPLTGCYLDIPALIHPKAVPTELQQYYLSYEQNMEAPVLPRILLNQFHEWYQGDPFSPEVSPLLNPNGHRNLPPIYLKVCGLDPLRDEALIFEKHLRDADVPTRLDIYPGLPHSFTATFPQLSASRKSLNDTVEGASWLLSNRSSS